MQFGIYQDCEAAGTKINQMEGTMRALFAVAVVAALFLSVGCTKSGTPGCGDSDVKKLVIDIINGELKKHLFYQVLRESPNKGVNRDTYQLLDLI